MRDFLTQLTAYQQRVNYHLTQHLEQLSTIAPQLQAAMHYALLLGGKRIRPYLVYATGDVLHVPLTQLDNAACAIECMHSYSLIHDDLPAMDNDDWRRGQPTCHRQFGEALAILAGDALQTFAFQLLSRQPHTTLSATQQLQMVETLADASGVLGMCAGQAADLAAEGQSINLTELTNIHHQKTGALIAAAVQLPAIAAQSNTTIQQALSTYAKAIGLAFQIQDDILDVIGKQDILGKTPGSDQAQHKCTYPELLGLTTAQTTAKQLTEQACDALIPLIDAGYTVTPLIALAHFVIERDN